MIRKEKQKQKITKWKKKRKNKEPYKQLLRAAENLVFRKKSVDAMFNLAAIWFFRSIFLLILHISA